MANKDRPLKTYDGLTVSKIAMLLARARKRDYQGQRRERIEKWAEFCGIELSEHERATLAGLPEDQS